ncbi:MAG TPA: Dyp-type peroxidase [Ignavibacteria bacterium]|nr:peroxidase [Bacteroidota bacterium]HRI85774.1 Dyp-type peroxidase [Ignavibacteria bacterium]HRJ99035.1 Dyp-type peroxidase [Ignavibacteria bacterium]
MKLELDDIQHYLLTRPNARIAQYDFLTFRNPESGRNWISALLHTVGNVESVLKSEDTDMRWVTIAFTYNGLKALGVTEECLSTFPDPFKQGMSARAKMLGDTGENHPDNWQDNITSPDLHAVIILFARDRIERDRCVKEHRKYLVKNPGVEILSTLLLEAIPPFDYVHEHFGYRDRLTTPVIEGMNVTPSPGSHPPSKPGEFILGYPDETGEIQPLPKPEILTKNGSYLAYRKMQEHVGRFRDYLKSNGNTIEEQELVAAKLMGRWRKSGAPLVLCPDKDESEVGWDDNKNNNFDYAEMDPHGYACPVGAHIRRMNVRDKSVSGIMNRRLIIRRGGTYGPHLPDDAPEDGADRGIAVFAGCADLSRQFEFLISVWSNDTEFMELNERDPFCGTQDGTLDFAIPKRPIKRKLKGIPAFTNVRGGAYFFLPGIKALKYLSDLR